MSTPAKGGTHGASFFRPASRMELPRFASIPIFMRIMPFMPFRPFLRLPWQRMPRSGATICCFGKGMWLSSPIADGSFTPTPIP